MKSWLTLKAFALGSLMMAVQQVEQLASAEITPVTLFLALLAVVVGGFFWGVVGVFFYNLFNRRS